MESKIILAHPKKKDIGCDIKYTWPEVVSDSDKKLLEEIDDIVLRDAVKCELESIFILRHVIGLLECFINGESTELNTYHDYLKFVSKFPLEIPGDRTCLHSDYRNALMSIQDLGKFSDAAAALYNKLLDVSYVGEDFDPAELNIAVSEGDRHFQEALLELHRYIESSLPYRLLIEALRFFKSHKSYNLEGWTNKRFESIDVGLDEYKALVPPRILWRVGSVLGYKLKKFREIQLELNDDDKAAVDRAIAVAKAAGKDTSLMYYYVRPQQLHFVDNKTESEKKLSGSGMEPYYTERRVLLIKQLINKLKNELIDFDVSFPELVSRVERRLPLPRLELERLIEKNELNNEFKRIEEIFPEISKYIGRCEGDLPFYRDGNVISPKRNDSGRRLLAWQLRKIRKNEGKNIPWMYLSRVFIYKKKLVDGYCDDTTNYWKDVKKYYNRYYLKLRAPLNSNEEL